MSCQLPIDCLREIFVYLEQDKVTLHSCLLVNRLWCEMTVRILWRDIWSFNDIVTPQHQRDVSLQIISTLVTCLSNESKDLLHKNGIFIATQRSLFNYASFCKVLSIHKIDRMIQQFFEKQQFINSQSLEHNKYVLISQEILKMFMEQISSLRSLDYLGQDERIVLTHFPGAKNCLTNLTELTCNSNVQSEFFYQLSKICHNIQSLNIEFGRIISNGLADLIHIQKNLKSVALLFDCFTNYTDKMEVIAITSSLKRFSSTLIKLKMNNCYYIPLSFIATFENLQELILSISTESFDDFNLLQYVTFPQLKVLKFLDRIPIVEVLIKFLELNGKNLKEFYVCDSGDSTDNSLYFAVAKFCPNLQTLSAVILNNEVDTLKLILSSCQYLESIKVGCGCGYLNEKEILEVIAKHSPKNFSELKLSNAYTRLELDSKDLETFLISWNNRIPQRSLSLIIFTWHDNLEVMDDKKMELIEKYKKLGTIKKFEIQKYNSEE